MRITKKKPIIKINQRLAGYLTDYGRMMDLPVKYNDLMRYLDSFPLFDKHGNNTLWDSLLYDTNHFRELQQALTRMYVLLKMEGHLEMAEHLETERIDFCHFGNSNPFRIKIVNMINDNYDYMYIKKADASRVYGLELEHLLSPNFVSYLVDGETLTEEHIAGIPGDQFIKDYMGSPNFNKVRFAKEFTKFNERCFVRLLGDMRSYNFVIDITPDFEDEQYRFRAIDFDQQSYEGSKSIYLPQYFKENNPIITMGMEFMNVETTRQYQYEERTLIARRLNLDRKRLENLVECMRHHQISKPEKVKQLKDELNRFHDTKEFGKCRNMGDILMTNLRIMLSDHVRKLEV